MRHFLFEDKEYRIRGTFKRRKDSRDAAAELARLLRSKSKPSAFRSGGGRRAADLRQNCVAKMRYSRSGAAHAFQLEYLVREGTGIEGGAAERFGTDAEDYRNNMADKNFRIFLSPQKPGVDLQSLAERFVSKLELQTGYRLYWQGACHYNTAHPHAHLLINGVDRLGRDIEFPKDVVKTFMRETARDLCTAQLGRRTKADLALEKEQECSARRFTRLDKSILALCGGTFKVNLDGVIPDKERILARLETLRDLKLCSFERGAYKLKAGWDADLQANGRYNTFLKAREALRYSPPSHMRVYEGGMGEITGRITQVYRMDGDASDSHAVVLESLDGRAYFVPLFKKPEVFDGTRNLPLAAGCLVTLKNRAGQTGRLTPRIVTRTIRQVQAAVRRGAYTGNLAREITGMKPTVSYETDYK